MNISVLALSALALVAVLGHVMASFWYLLSQFQSRLCQRKIYDLPFRKDQIKRELRNSILRAYARCYSWHILSAWFLPWQ